MPIAKIKLTKYPKRQWALASFANTGKTTLAAAMRKPLLVGDSDDRFAESAMLLGLSEEHAMVITDDSGNRSVDPDVIVATLNEARGEKIEFGTVLLDSLTGIIQPKVTAAVEAEGKDRAVAMRDKASTMRKLIDAIQNFGGDYLLVWHHENRGDKNGQARIHETVPPTERDALTRALNMELVTVKEEVKGGGFRYGVQVVWARYGEFGMIVWDEQGNFFRGMPEKIEAAVYKNGVKAFAPAAAKSAEAPAAAPATPKAPDATSPAAQVVTSVSTTGTSSTGEVQPQFTDKAAALRWAVEKNAFGSYDEASAAYAQLREKIAPQSAADMFAGWKKHVEEKLAGTAGAAGSMDY